MASLVKGLKLDHMDVRARLTLAQERLRIIYEHGN